MKECIEKLKQLRKEGYKLAEAIVYLYILSEGGRLADARVASVAEATGYTVQRVSQAMNALEARGVLVRDRMKHTARIVSDETDTRGGETSEAAPSAEA